MKFIIDLNELYELKIEPQHYCWLYLQYLCLYKESWLISPITNSDLIYLEVQNFIKIIGEGDEPEVSLRKNALELFEEFEGDRKWNEFKSKYPTKVGNRRLHDNTEGCKTKYLSLSKEHNSIIKGLENELLARVNAAKKGEFFPDQKTMSSWLNRKHWETYLDYEDEEKKERIKGI